jgi:hypothetical protein
MISPIAANSGKERALETLRGCPSHPSLLVPECSCHVIQCAIAAAQSPSTTHDGDEENLLQTDRKISGTNNIHCEERKKEEKKKEENKKEKVVMIMYSDSDGAFSLSLLPHHDGEDLATTWCDDGTHTHTHT